MGKKKYPKNRSDEFWGAVLMALFVLGLIGWWWTNYASPAISAWYQENVVTIWVVIVLILLLLTSFIVLWVWNWNENRRSAVKRTIWERITS